MAVKLHNWPLSPANECTGCLGANAQGPSLFYTEGGGLEGGSFESDGRQTYLERRNFMEKKTTKKNKGCVGDTWKRGGKHVREGKFLHSLHIWATPSPADVTFCMLCCATYSWVTHITASPALFAYCHCSDKISGKPLPSWTVGTAVQLPFYLSECTRRLLASLSQHALSQWK